MIKIFNRCHSAVCISLQFTVLLLLLLLLLLCRARFSWLRAVKTECY